jgi:hypothetical protein
MTHPDLDGDVPVVDLDLTALQRAGNGDLPPLSVPNLDADVDTLTAALAYAEAGWYVGPLRGGSKNPGSILGDNWPHQTSRDPQKIIGWFAGTQAGAVGLFLHCGRSGAWVADIDDPTELHPDLLRAAVDPDVRPPFQMTRPDDRLDRGHLVFAQPPGRCIGNTTGRLGSAWGEGRGLNGVIVVFPTAHPDGGCYRWRRTGPVPAMPDYVADKLDDTTPAEDAATDGEVAAFVAAHTGTARPTLLVAVTNTLTARIDSGESRHQSALLCCCWALREAAAGYYPAAEAVEALGDIFRAAAVVARPTNKSGKPDAVRSPAAAADEWAGIVAWAVAQAEADDHQQRRAEVDGRTDDFGWVPPELRPGSTGAKHGEAGHGAEAAAGASDDHPDLLAGLRSGAWLDAQQFAPLQYAVPRLVPEGSTLLVGPPKVGKSWLVLGLGLAAASGGKAFGAVPVEQRPVLYLALEDGDRRLQDRCRALLLWPGEHIPAALSYLTTVDPLRVVETIALWLDRHHDDAPLVLLDTLGKVMPAAKLGESTYQRDYRVGSDLKRVVDAHPGASLLVNHHDRKAGALDFVDSVSGTHGLAGAADTVVVLSRQRHEADGLLQVTGRDVTEDAYAVRFPGSGAWRLQGDSLDAAAEAAARQRVAAGLGDLSREVLDFVAEHAAGVRYRDVEAALGDNAGRYLTRLAEAGRVRKAGRGLYVPALDVDHPADATATRLAEPPARDVSEVSEVSDSGAGQHRGREFGPKCVDGESQGEKPDTSDTRASRQSSQPPPATAPPTANGARACGDCGQPATDLSGLCSECLGARREARRSAT